MPEEMLVGQCLPPYYISQLGDCIIISGSFKFVDFSIIHAWELQVDDGEVPWYRKLFTIPYQIEHNLKLIGFTKDKQPIVEASFLAPVVRSYSSTHVEPSTLTPNPVTIIPGPAGIVQLSGSTRVEPSSSTSNPVRIIPSPTSLVQRDKLLKENVFILDPDGALIGVWVSVTNYVNAFGGTVTGCLGDIDNFLKKGKLEQVVEIVKSCFPNALGDLNVTLKDLSGTVPGTINYKVLDVSSYGKDITFQDQENSEDIFSFEKFICVVFVPDRNIARHAETRIDTRNSITNHLPKPFGNANIKTFLDDNEIETGLYLKPELESAIRASRASIVVLSKNYASSTWCLNELVLILEQHMKFNHIVIPVFYHVDPSDVRKQQNSFGDAMADHKQKMEAETNAEKKNEWAQKMGM
ncbi:hypothetical protein Tco_0625801 [Tanacetum coccineum]|uniref:TIR domain-containing protein n=1 Tax=Tanacetum coccineum TaxID=301880 RepID=A0ABQ4WHZ2_9ASTR